MRPTTGAPDLDREIHDLADLGGIGLGQRAAEDGEILGEDEDRPSIDPAVAGDDAVARRGAVSHAEIGTAVLDERVGLLEAALVEKLFDALAGRQLALFVLPFNPFLATADAVGCQPLLQPIHDLAAHLASRAGRPCCDDLRHSTAVATPFPAGTGTMTQCAGHPTPNRRWTPSWLDQLAERCNDLRGGGARFEDLYLEQRLELKAVRDRRPDRVGGMPARRSGGAMAFRFAGWSSTPAPGFRHRPSASSWPNTPIGWPCRRSGPRQWPRWPPHGCGSTGRGRSDRVWPPIPAWCATSTGEPAVVRRDGWVGDFFTGPRADRTIRRCSFSPSRRLGAPVDRRLDPAK